MLRKIIHNNSKIIVCAAGQGGNVIPKFIGIVTKFCEIFV